MSKKMKQVNFFQNFNKPKPLASKKLKQGEKVSETEDNLIVEEYEGRCEECERETKEKVCPICES